MRNAKVRIDNLRFIDSRKMQKQGIFKNSAGQYTWRNAETNEVTSRMNYQYQDSILTLSYNCKGESYHYSVYIDRTECNYGGYRSWFICPNAKCGKRVAKLYIGASDYYLCRHCNNGNYAVQQISHKDKPLHHMHKMRDKLGWRYDHVPFLARIRKPKYMHHKTFKAMVDKHDKYEYQVVAVYQAFFDKFGVDLK